MMSSTECRKRLRRNSNVIDLQTNHNFFMKLAEFMFNHDLTLYEIIHSKIYDKMFNGREYELINSRSFFRILSEKGLKISEDEKKAVNNLLKSHFLLDVIEVDKIAKILEELDIKEDIPNASKNYDYKHLSAHDIRIMNRVVKYMDDNNIEEIEDFIGRDRISVIEVIGKSKREDVKILNANDFLESLLEKNLLDDDELNEGLQMFFAISVDNIDKLMVRKIKKWVKDFKNVKYFKYFGTIFRDEETVLSDIDDESSPVSMQDAFRSNIQNKAQIIEHKGKRNPKLRN